MGFLVELTEARRCLEVGTFTGYSALAVALALPPDGRVVTCDIDEETTAVARRYWAEAGVADKIELRLGAARATLEQMIGGGEAGGFDFAFIDADKENYGVYYEQTLALLRPGGLMLIDNVLWSGAVADPARDDSDTVAIRALNQTLRDDPRVSLSLLPIGDGLSLARKRPGA
jgi:caffeoyl-CoA O-methyltransferase